MVRWFKKEGSKIKQGEPDVELETDKVNYELDSPAAGVLLKIVAAIDAEVPFGDPLCCMWSRSAFCSAKKTQWKVGSPPASQQFVRQIPGFPSAKPLPTISNGPEGAAKVSRKVSRNSAFESARNSNAVLRNMP